MMFILEQNFLPVTWQVIVPLRFSRGQYVQVFIALHLFLIRFGFANEVMEVLRIGRFVVPTVRFVAELLESNSRGWFRVLLT